ncbi:hypothetical protein GGI07_000411 [Coemansia sp. Benny D115]|nr:hypothetical protein GGI07_000411 [Coemansia sp. Benny D115]
MPRTTAASVPTTTTKTSTTTLSTRKPETMDKIFSFVAQSAVAGQQAAAFAGQQCQAADRSAAYLLPSSFGAESFDAWTCAETQQSVFEDWIATSAPPNTALASPTLDQHALMASALSFSSLPVSPSLSPPTMNMSLNSSPLLSGDVALSLATQIGGMAAISPAQQPLADVRSALGSFSAADYAAVLFPDIAASLTGALVSPTGSASPEPCSAGVKRSFSETSMHSAYASATESQSASAWSATDFAGLFETSSPAPVAATVAPAGAAVVPTLSASDADADAEEQRKRRDTEFLASLPPQLALKRRRTSNTKQKEKILAELLGDESAAAVAAVATEPLASVPAVAAAPAKKAEPAAALAEADEEEGDEGLDAAALKRKKNTDAARRSRMRKILRIETLEGRVSELETENSKLAQMLAAVEAEKAAMAQRLAQMEKTAAGMAFAL